MSRALAVLVAVTLIVVAALARGAIDDDGDGETDRESSVMRIVCGEELRAACDALSTTGGVEVRVEALATTAERLDNAPADDPGLEIWIAPAPWPEIVDGNRARAGSSALFMQQMDLARSDLAAIVPESIGPCDWACLGDRATSDLRFGGRPLDSGLGILHTAALTAGRLDTTDYASNDLDTATQAWLRGIADAIDPVPSPVTRMLQIRASFDVALTHGAEAEQALAMASEDRSAGLSVTYPDPVISVVAVAAAVGDVEVPDDLADALRGAGWSDVSDEPSGLPSAGVLTALLEVVG